MRYVLLPAIFALIENSLWTGPAARFIALSEIVGSAATLGHMLSSPVEAALLAAQTFTVGSIARLRSWGGIGPGGGLADSLAVGLPRLRFARHLALLLTVTGLLQLGPCPCSTARSR